MTLDPYSPCPGGTGKKIKFCCSDLVHELDMLQRMIDGDQRVAGLEYVSKLDAKYPGRACLLSARATLEAMLGNREQSAATLTTFREKYPDNPIALAELAMLQATGEKPTDAIGTLEKAFELCTSEIPSPLYEAYGTVAESLAGAQHFPAAQALFWFQASLSRGEDKKPLQQWAMLEAEPGIPLLLKLPRDLERAPAGAPWKYEFDLARERVFRGQWHATAEKFAALIPIAGKSPALWQNLARVRAWTADYAGAAEAWRKCATLDVPLDDAVEAEATALVFEMHGRALQAEALPPSPGDQLKATFSVNDQSTLDQRFAADRHFERIPIDPRAWRETMEGTPDDQPPPRACFSLLDRPLPASADVSRADVPLILGTMFLFGRQTDRPERLEMVVRRSDLPAARDLLARIGGDALGEMTEEVVRQDSLNELGMHWQFRFPDGMSAQRRFEVDQAEAEHRILEVWPETSMSQLDGKTLRQAASDPGLRNRAMAFILLMQGAGLPDNDGQTFRELRTRLGLPIPATIDPTTVNLAELPRIRLGRLQADRLEDDQLLQCFARAKTPRQPRAIEWLAKEIVGRPSLAGQVEVPDAYNALLAQVADLTTALQIVEQGRAAAQRAKLSTVSWDLSELRLRIERGEEQEASRVLRHLEREHSREPGVAEAMFQLLYEYGLIDEHGRRIVRSDPQASPLIVPGAAAPTKILVPGGETATAGEASKPVIWTPGMD